MKMIELIRVNENKIMSMRVRIRQGIWLDGKIELLRLCFPADYFYDR